MMPNDATLPILMFSLNCAPSLHDTHRASDVATTGHGAPNPRQRHQYVLPSQLARSYGTLSTMEITPSTRHGACARERSGSTTTDVFEVTWPPLYLPNERPKKTYH
jgi:hypothetical protein